MIKFAKADGGAASPRIAATCWNVPSPWLLRGAAGHGASCLTRPLPLHFYGPIISLLHPFTVLVVSPSRGILSPHPAIATSAQTAVTTLEQLLRTCDDVMLVMGTNHLSGSSTCQEGSPVRIAHPAGKGGRGPSLLFGAIPGTIVAFLPSRFNERLANPVTFLLSKNSHKGLNISNSAA